MRAHRLLLAVALALSLASCGGGGGAPGDIFNFDNPLIVPTDVQVADIDGDGRPDVVGVGTISAGGSERGLLVVRRQASGDVFTADRYEFGEYPWRVVVADIDSDGAPDLVVADTGNLAGSTHGGVWLLRQDSAHRGSFLAAQKLATTAADNYGVAVGDVDGDGAADILLASSVLGGNALTLLLQDRTHRGSFLAPREIALPGHASLGGVAVGDVNGDGRADIVARIWVTNVAGVSSSALGVLYQQSGGVFTAFSAIAQGQAGFNIERLRVMDVNADGIPDIVEFGTPASSDYRSEFHTLVQSAAARGTFTRLDLVLPQGIGNGDADWGLLDGDARVDAASAGFYPTGSSAHLFTQDAAGALQRTRDFALPFAAAAVTVGDINGDGRNDIVVMGADMRTLLFAALLQGSGGSWFGPGVLD